MKFLTDHSTKIPLSSPEETIAFRESRDAGKGFDDYGPLSQEIATKIANIHKIHGYKYEEASVGLLLRASNELLFNYDFKAGFQMIFGPSVFPDHIQVEARYKIIEYSILILEAFDWVVSFSEDESFYYLNFGPLLALTPEEVTFEIDRRISTLAAEALKVINAGLVRHQSRFFRAKLGLAPGNILAPDYRLVIKKLRDLLGPKWYVSDMTEYLDIYPNSLPPVMKLS